ncbi:voltage-gated potassium channel [Pleomassaria siparia CBS 279.74]|uniref:Voltage-gated potassium channel n=1 Tax=Pleomassaria siparia CBS 279.74 TaxID=1314801 RepID=A0A6G1K7E9_9PLEO|nr:voltage-gated potassium channel [Pleomassaria siparia CBS 279.74]
MPSLLEEFTERRQRNEPFGKSFKNAVFQAKNTAFDLDGEEAAQRFKLWKVRMRGRHDDSPVDWWFASTAIPILAATLGPLANVLSIGALVTFWRLDLRDPADSTATVSQLQATPIRDPRWCYWINVASLVLGFVGNFFLLLNFTNRIRYIISLPMTIMLWFISCGILIGDLTAMHVYNRPVAPYETYSGGFWYAIAAASFYFLLASTLMINLVGYVRGHYPQYFDLTEDQRTLIVQTIFYFIWLGGGAGVYARIEGWQYNDALYYCNVTILTIGFGDLYPTKTSTRALLIPFSLGGIIMLGLVVSSIYRSVQELGEQKITRSHIEHQRQRTEGRTVATSLELQRKEIEAEMAHERAMAKHAARPSSRSPATALQYRMTMSGGAATGIHTTQSNTLHVSSWMKKNHKVKLLRDEKLRFDEMRNLQQKAKLWKNSWRLSISLSIFTIFWCVGAVAFWKAEGGTTGQSYWETVYFCWVAILSIGYGDFAPKTGAGRCFFLIWSIIAVPSITMLASDLTSTVVSAFNTWSSRVADFTILPKEGIWTSLVEKHPWLSLGLAKATREWQIKHNELRNRVETLENILRENGKEEGSSSAGTMSKDDAYAAGILSPSMEALAAQAKQPDAAALARQLALAIRRTAHDLTLDTPRAYKYEEWVEITRLIRFSTAKSSIEVAEEEEEEGLVQWDWLGENSPMMAEQSESEFVLDRLCESLVRYLRRNPPVDRFAVGVKERGENALRLRTATMAEGGERQVLPAGPVEGESSKAQLHVLPEEHEHETYH